MVKGLRGLSFVAVASTSAFCHAQWTETILSSPGSSFAAATGASGSQQVGYQYNDGPPANYFASMWNGSTNTWQSLNPTGATESSADATDGVHQVGFVDFGVAAHASLWSGTANSWVDLNPFGMEGSEAHDIYGNTQVGTGQVTANGPINAGIWSGTASSWVNLNPAGASGSNGWGIYGNQEVGPVYFGNTTVAGLWEGTASSFVNLNPAGATGSEAGQTSGTQQVGDATFGNSGDPQGSLWSGTAASWVDLNPSGATLSYATGIYGSEEVGYKQIGGGIYAGGTQFAGVWHGTAASWEPLPQTTDSARAFGITVSNGTTYVVGSDGDNAVIWTEPAAAPEPAPLIALGLSAVVLTRRRRRA